MESCPRGSLKLWAQHQRTVGRPKTADNSSKKPILTATNSAPRPGDFPLGSASSRAAVRLLLESKKRTAEQEANRPPDLRIVIGIPRPQEIQRTFVRRVRNGNGITEFVFPAPAYKGECLGICSVPTDVGVEEALRLLREHRHKHQ
jgi:hypothetical protein